MGSQRKLLEELRNHGHDATMANELLTQFEALLQEHREHLQRIISEMNRS